MEKRGIKRAVIVGHSFGGAIAAAFGVRHPDKTEGLLFLAPATHPWPGGIDWYYHLAAMPMTISVGRCSTGVPAMPQNSVAVAPGSTA